MKENNEWIEQLHDVATRAWCARGIPLYGGNFWIKTWKSYIVAYHDLQNRTGCTWEKFLQELERGITYCRKQFDRGQGDKQFNRLAAVVHDPGRLFDCAATARKEEAARLRAKRKKHDVAPELPAGDRDAILDSVRRHKAAFMQQHDIAPAPLPQKPAPSAQARMPVPQASPMRMPRDPAAITRILSAVVAARTRKDS